MTSLPCSAAVAPSDGASTRAAPPTATAPSSTRPRLLHGRSSTRGSRRRRLTLPLSATVVTTSASPSRAIHTGLATGAPVRRKVVNETNLWSAISASADGTVT